MMTARRIPLCLFLLLLLAVLLAALPGAASAQTPTWEEVATGGELVITDTVEVVGGWKCARQGERLSGCFRSVQRQLRVVRRVRPPSDSGAPGTFRSTLRQRCRPRTCAQRRLFVR